MEDLAARHYATPGLQGDTFTILPAAGLSAEGSERAPRMTS